MNRTKRILVLATLLLLILPCLFAQEFDSEGFNLFGSDEVLEVSLKFDMTGFIRNKSDEDYIDAELIYHFSNVDSLVNKIRVRCRGHSRFDLCVLPPIRLNFNHCENRPVDIDDISNVKLVTHCRDNYRFEDYVLKEYLAYRLYNVVTDTSFRVRLLHIKYIDTGPRHLSCYRYGFVIEPVDLLAARLNTTENETIPVRPVFIDPVNYDRLCLFQYMIGNDDWNLPNLHNLKLFETETGNSVRFLAVPYDFDYSGLVQTFYAIPNELHGQDNILDRVYIGPCRSDSSFYNLMDYFLDRKDDFYREIEKVDFIDQRQAVKITRYLDSFFNEYKRNRLYYNIKKTCIRR